MGNQKSTYRFSNESNSSIQSKKSKKISISLHCGRLHKNKEPRNKKSHMFKSKSLIIPNISRKKSDTSCKQHMTTSISELGNKLDLDKIESISNDNHVVRSNNKYERQDSTQSARRSTLENPKLSESSLNSDDLMFTTDVSLDQIDDTDELVKEREEDDLETTEIVGLHQQDQHIKRLSLGKYDLSDGDKSIETENSEQNDIFIDSKDSSTKLPHKPSSVYRRRPHSLSTPTQPISPECSIKSDHMNDIRKMSSNMNNSSSYNNYQPIQQSSNPSNSSVNTNPNYARRSTSVLSNMNGIDIAWTWMLSSETANIAQDVSSLKLLLIKLRKVLMIDNNFLSEPTTPLSGEEHELFHHTLNEETVTKNWKEASKEDLLRELDSVQKKNQILQMELKEKDRIIDLLKDHRYYRKSSRRLQSSSFRNDDNTPSRINRSSTFDESSELYRDYCQDSYVISS